MNSIWKETITLPEFEPLGGDTKTDVLIIGGGAAGLLTAHALQEAGTDCLLVEAGRICDGVTGNTTAKITSQHGLIYGKLLKSCGSETAKAYWLANQEAINSYATLCRDIPCDFEPRDSYIYSVNSPAKLEDELNALEKLNIPADFVQEPGLPIRTAGAVRFREQAQFNPLKFFAGIAAGLNIREHTKVLAFSDGAVRTDRGRIRAEHIVVATHFPILNKHGSYFMKLYQNRSYVLALENAGKVDGMYLDEAESGLSFRTYGRYLLLGGCSHRTGKPSGGWAPLEKFAAYHYPGAKTAFKWAAQDCISLDQMPYIGRYSKRTHNLYTATGFNKWGMSSSMAAAGILRDIIHGKHSPYEAVFSPSRTMLRPQLLANTAETLKTFVTPTTPRCPHMGCALKWNKAEHSWDCPCHGSRFTSGGRLLNEPSNGDMKKPPR